MTGRCRRDAERPTTGPSLFGRGPANDASEGTAPSRAAPLSERARTFRRVVQTLALTAFSGLSGLESR